MGDERQNLNKDVNGVIIAFGDLGLWNGRKQGYQILGDNIAGILQSTQYDAEWYGDGYDIRGRMSHHDGTNYVLYRVAENRDDAERIAAKIYNYEIDEVLSRTADTCCCKIFLSEISKSVFSASSLPVLAANPVGRKIINLSVQEVSKGNK